MDKASGVGPPPTAHIQKKWGHRHSSDILAVAQICAEDKGLTVKNAKNNGAQKNRHRKRYINARTSA